MSGVAQRLHSIWCAITGKCDIIDRDAMMRADPTLRRWKGQERAARVAMIERRQARGDFTERLYTGSE